MPGLWVDSNFLMSFDTKKVMGTYWGSFQLFVMEIFHDSKKVKGVDGGVQRRVEKGSSTIGKVFKARRSLLWGDFWGFLKGFNFQANFFHTGLFSSWLEEP